VTITTSETESDIPDALRSTTVPQDCARVSEHALFPLPITPFERFLYDGEARDYPATFYVELHLEGQFDRSALETALEAAVKRHPLLSCQLSEEGRSHSWTPVAQLPQIVWQGATDPVGPPLGRWIDLRQGCGLRAWVREQVGRGDVLHLQFHHSCTDGLGAGRFIVDLMAVYSRLTGPPYPKLDVPSPDAAKLKHRWQFRRRSQTTSWQKALNAYRFHVLAPTPLAAPVRRPAPSNSLSPVIASYLFERDETQAFSSKITLLGNLTINDVAVALLFRAVSSWQQLQGRTSNRQRLRILMPVDFRESTDRLLPAANRIGFSFPTRLIKECHDWGRLLSSLAEEIRFIRRTNLGMDFLGGLSLTDSVPGLLPTLLRSSGCMATTLITNFGQSRRYEQVFPADDGSMIFGNVRLHHIVATPPISRSTSAGFGICITSGRLVLSVQCDPQLFDNQTASELLQEFVSAWRQWSDDRMSVSM